jgi:hypothetical protein
LFLFIVLRLKVEGWVDYNNNKETINRATCLKKIKMNWDYVLVYYVQVKLDCVPNWSELRGCLPWNLVNKR